MTATQDTLLLSSADRAVELGELAPAGRMAHRGDPYEALEALAAGSYKSLLLAPDYPDLPALLRAVRRVHGSVRAVAICQPQQEPLLRDGNCPGLDDYFIYPPSREEIDSIFAPARAQATVAARAELSAPEVASLIASADSVESLAQKLAQDVAALVGCPVRWVDACSAEAFDRPGLLLIDDDPPRVLVADGSAAPGQSVQQRLQNLQLVVNPLVAGARRAQGLHKLAVTDDLTGAYNRRYFYNFTDGILGRARDERFRVTLLLYDLDNFKSYNDTYGHAVGDEILREMATLMKQVTREQDVVARIGGDEFTVLFWDAEPPRQPESQHPQTATVLANRFVRVLASHNFPSLGPKARGTLTISGGLASFPRDGSTCRELLRKADAALRAAKESGKNAIYLIGGGDKPERAGQD